MGECKINPELFYSLDYISPQVNKTQKILKRDLLFGEDYQKQTELKLIKDSRTKIKRITSLSNSYDSELHASSLVSLKKRTGELIHEEYSIFDSNNQSLHTNKYSKVTEDHRRNYLGKNKPMIKITVVPKVAETKTSKVFNKRREKTKILQTTVSNQENSLGSKNIYLTVKGKRHAKVYELKTAESTNLSRIVNTKYEDISIQQISNSKRLISSLNMERNKRKNKNNIKINNKDNLDCSCHNSKKDNEIKNLSPRKSKVTIVGQLGLTRDDRYVLKCAATVDDKPITTNFVQIDNNTSAGTRNPTNASPHDSKIQTDTCLETISRYPDLKHTKNRMASQATQVNFNQVKNIKSKDFKSQVAHCNCSSSINGNVVNMGTDDEALRECKNPLVVITVYPRHNKEDNIHNSVKIIRCPDVPQKPVVSNMEYNLYKSRKGKPIKEETFPVNQSEQKSIRGRSPSPASKTVQKKAMTSKTDDKIVEKNNRKNTNTRLWKTHNVSPERQKNVNKSREKLSYMTKEKSCDCYYSQNLGNLELLKHPVNSKVSKKADTKEVKRALVNNFLKSVDRIDGRKLFAPKDTSRIAINIDGEKDRYNVFFEERNFDTGLTIRKTLKKYSQTNSADNEGDFNSMENFLMLSDEIKGTYDEEIYSRESRDLSNLLLRESRLNVRDSLELCYSRPGRADLRFNPTHITSKYELRETFNTDFLAPVKHFRGDDCPIPDPNERDKEIRELLGIVRNKRKIKTDVPADTEDNHTENQEGKGCCCRKKCSTKDLMMGLSISKFLSSKYLKRKSKKQRILKASTQSKKRASEVPKKSTTQALFNTKQETDVMKSHKVSYASWSGSINKEKTKEMCDYLPAKFPKEEIHKAVPQKGNKKSEEKVTILVSQKEENSSSEKEETNNFDEKAAYKKIVTPTGVAQNKPNVTPDIIRKEPVIEQNVILNRNIQVFLQVEQFTKQRPIILTRKQYDKVKKTIQCTISNNLSVEQRKRRSLRNCNVMSVGEITIKPRFQQFRYDREIQTERFEFQRNVRSIHIQTPHRCKTQITKLRNSLKSKINHAQNNKLVYITDSNIDMDFNRNINGKHLKPNEDDARQTVSSMEVRYANVTYMEHVALSSTQFGDGIHNTINCHKPKKHSNSIHTLFKGRRKCVTPNLGTSAYSLCSDVTDACNTIKCFKPLHHAGDSKPKKPFLQRLISCLVMRSAETSMFKEVPVRKPSSVNSSVDSYHISTSLGALEMTSSLYDTSASFYSNHTTQRLNKMKRGFFSSVRGFLTTRRS